MTNKAISSNYAGYCSACRTRYAVGTKIHRGASGKWEHAECPSSLPEKNPTKIYAAGPQRSTEKTNRKADNCQHCGSWVAAGAGLLVYCPEDSGCMEHHDYSGYHVRCSDEAACGERRAAAIAAGKAKQAAATALKAARAAVAPIGEAIASCARAQLLEGLEECSAPVTTVLGALIATYEAGGWTTVYRSASLPDGRAAVTVEHHGSDDYRSYAWVPADAARVARLTYAAERGITREAAQEWLAKYDGCVGADLYRTVAEGT